MGPCKRTFLTHHGSYWHNTQLLWGEPHSGEGYMIYAGIPTLFLRMNPQTSSRASYTIYPVPQNAPDVSAGRNVPGFPEGTCPKATDVSLWYGVYTKVTEFSGILTSTRAADQHNLPRQNSVARGLWFVWRVAEK